MGRLPDRDVEGLLGFLHEASQADGPDVFTEASVEALSELTRAEAGAACITFSGLTPDVPPHARSLLSFSDIDCEWCVVVGPPWTDELDAACRQYIEQQDPHPPVPALMNRVVRRSDLVRKAKYRRRGLWVDVERESGAEDALCLWLEVPEDAVLRRILLLTGRRGGFTDRDLRVLELLAPHLVRLYSRAARRRATPQELEVLTPREREVIALIAAGRTNREAARYLWISPHTVRAHLENIFEKLEVTTRAAAVARFLGVPPPA